MEKSVAKFAINATSNQTVSSTLARSKYVKFIIRHINTVTSRPYQTNTQLPNIQDNPITV